MAMRYCRGAHLSLSLSHKTDPRRHLGTIHSITLHQSTVEGSQGPKMFGQWTVALCCGGRVAASSI
eukprot:24281-Eustigmatos_ZCMA.PRE.1